MLTFLIFLTVVVISGIVSVWLARSIIQLPRRWEETLRRNRGWIALLAVAGCLAWYPLHGIFRVDTFPISVAFATGMCIAVLW